MKAKLMDFGSLKKTVCVAALMIMGTNSHAASHPGNNECLDGAQPLLTVADFSGDGIVDNTDLLMIGKVLRNEQYIAFFDRDADGDVDLTDLDLANQDLGQSSMALDQEIAEVYWATTKYRFLGQAALDGFVPITPVIKEHGRHWVQPYILADSTYPNQPQRAKPEGLNYDEQGNLLAVYWGQIAETDAEGFITSPAPDVFFTPNEINPMIMWHKHEQTCVTDLGFIDTVKFSVGVTPQQCVQSQGLSDGIATSFYMQHLWLYYLNPWGAFSTEHPCAGEGGVTPPHH